jgi:hypothetical protein
MNTKYHLLLQAALTNIDKQKAFKFSFKVSDGNDFNSKLIHIGLHKSRKAPVQDFKMLMSTVPNVSLTLLKGSEEINDGYHKESVKVQSKGKP